MKRRDDLRIIRKIKIRMQKKNYTKIRIKSKKGIKI